MPEAKVNNANAANATNTANTTKTATRFKTEKRPRFIPRRRVCSFCVNKNEVIDYKEAAKLKRFISDRGKIDPRRKTGTCARHQRLLALAIKRARFMAMLPYTAAHIRKTGGVGAQ